MSADDLTSVFLSPTPPGCRAAAKVYPPDACLMRDTRRRQRAVSRQREENATVPEGQETAETCLQEAAASEAGRRLEPVAGGRVDEDRLQPAAIFCGGWRRWTLVDRSAWSHGELKATVLSRMWSVVYASWPTAPAPR